MTFFVILLADLTSLTESYYSSSFYLYLREQGDRKCHSYKLKIANFIPDNNEQCHCYIHTQSFNLYWYLYTVLHLVYACTWSSNTARILALLSSSLYCIIVASDIAVISITVVLSQALYTATTLTGGVRSHSPHNAKHSTSKYMCTCTYAYLQISNLWMACGGVSLASVPVLPHVQVGTCNTVNAYCK